MRKIDGFFPYCLGRSDTRTELLQHLLDALRLDENVISSHKKNAFLRRLCVINYRLLITKVMNEYSF